MNYLFFIIEENNGCTYNIIVYVILLQSFTNQNAFIITNYPTQGDAVDFLRLITDYDSEVVVCMEPLYNVESVRIMLQCLICNIEHLKLVFFF